MEFNQANVAMFIDFINQLLAGNRTVQLRVEGGGPDVFLPNGVTLKIPNSATLIASRIGNGVRLTSSRPHITVSKQVAFMRAKGRLASISAPSPDRIDIEIDGLPDQSIEVPE